MTQPPKDGTYRATAEQIIQTSFNSDGEMVDVIESALRACASEARRAAIEEVKEIFLDYDYDEACERVEALKKEKP